MLRKKFLDRKMCATNIKVDLVTIKQYKQKYSLKSANKYLKITNYGCVVIHDF